MVTGERLFTFAVIADSHVTEAEATAIGGYDIDTVKLGAARSRHVVHDNFTGIDRGYFPRTGVLDRMYNPRPGFHVVRHMNAALNMVDGELSAAAAGDCPGGRYIQFEAGKGTIVLALPDADATEMSVPFGAAHGAQIDLGSGEIAPAAMADDNIVAVTVLLCDGVTVPVLIIPG